MQRKEINLNLSSSIRVNKAHFLMMFTLFVTVPENNATDFFFLKECAIWLGDLVCLKRYLNVVIFV